MSATSADIAAALRDASVATWADATVGARYPSSPDGSISPATGYFDSLADAVAVIAARGALIGAERRRFVALAHDIVLPDVTEGIPQVHLVDSEQAVSGTHLASRIEIDLDAETTSYELFG